MNNKIKEIFVCYEENYNELTYDAGTVNELCVYQNEKDALNWFIERVNQGIEDNFVLDIEDEIAQSETECNVDVLKEEIKKGNACITMFRQEQENYNESYSICITKEKIL